MYLWLAVTADEFELPLVVADSAEQLANELGTDRKQIYRVIWGEAEGKIPLRKYFVRKVWVPDDEL